jgi:hypothetical protein
VNKARKADRQQFQDAVCVHFKDVHLEELFRMFKWERVRYAKIEVQEMWVGWCLAKGLKP